MNSFGNKLNRGALLGLSLVLHCHVTFAGQAAIRAPVCYRWGPGALSDLFQSDAQPQSARQGSDNEKSAECNADISIHQVHLSYQKLMNGISKCIDSAHTEQEKDNCRRLTTVTTHHECSSEETLGSYYYWARINDFSDGPQAFSAVRDHAEKGDVFGGHVIVEADSSSQGEQHLALCRVKTINTVSGPPTNCVTIAIITQNSVWMRGGEPQAWCYLSASFRPTGAINIHWKIKTHRTPDELAEAVMKMLQSDLGLTTDMRVQKDSNGVVRSVALTAVAPIRESKILPSGWRESIDFDLHFYFDSDIVVLGDPPQYSPKRELVSLNGVAHALVSRLALGSLTQFQGLDDAQRSAYATALDKKTSAAIRSVCKTSREIDASTISCD